VTEPVRGGTARVTYWRPEPPESERSDTDADTDLAEAELVDEPHDDDVHDDDVAEPAVPASALAVGIEEDDPSVAPSDLDETGPRYPGDTGVRYGDQRAKKPSWRDTNSLTLIFALGALLVGGAIAALVITLTGGSSDSTELGKNLKLGSSLPTVAQSGADPAAGVPAPAIQGTDLDGNALAVPKDGRPHVLFVMAHWCPHCQAAVPQLVKLNEQNAMNGVSFYGIVSAITPEGDNYPPSDWLHRENWPFPTFLDNADNQIAQTLGVTAFPFYVFVNAQSNVVARLAGDLSDAQLKSLFTALASGQQLPIQVGGGSSQAPTATQPAPSTTAPRATTTTRRDGR
jgi:thiol-disulfide isomerase/thioredoxin